MGYDRPDHKNYVRSRKKSSVKTGLLVAIIAIVIVVGKRSLRKFDVYN
ncbi:hypothetical protein [Sporofaciens sp. JLR.KK001]|jgi:hypothetical protein